MKLTYIDWILTRYCNYRCSYCSCGDGSHASIQTVKDVLQYVKARLPDIQLNLSGGEPTTHPNIEEIVAFCADHSIFFSIDTNLSMSKELMNRVIDKGRNVLKYTHITYHPEFADFADFVDKVRLFYSCNLESGLRIIARHDAFDEVKSLYEQFNNIGLYIKPKIEKLRRRNNSLMKNSKLASYDKYYEQWLKRVLNKPGLTIRNLSCLGKHCRAGLSYQVIDENGFIYRCASANRDNQTLGHVTDLPITNIHDEFICSFNICKCREAESLNLI